MCDQYEPIFWEKSPHHLLYWSALSLIVECIEQLKGHVDFLLIGLVRNLIDTLYSAFRRWRTPPEVFQYEWLRAYTNLRRLVEELGEYSSQDPSGLVAIVRYEDLATSLEPVAPVFDFCGTIPSPDAKGLNRESLLKWQQDRSFGFTLAPEVKALAKSYGYDEAELTNGPSLVWPVYRDGLRGAYQSTHWGKNLYLACRAIPLICCGCVTAQPNRF